ncbi:MAG: aromatic-ring-hydroxylating dioxygenase subunit beta [Hydrogenophaga sp.]|uniref:aromatic-ring-hydroxylating dioxygenase subunit beta n=1 Tax=Hydrogenophaga sp. TaxID=1904254 RepID=UPI002730BD58|nr:aromatic-ring-hydroxylating dioxygenase subunit beta [Hydrogenophaga sp.]MDP2405194.1 aromatic-ring-hydroxylating dioxygenase subunit beta [Hydrogenophaga sp.]MDZ4177527.1 aromatic-ring-hydroxylating dioxygenase subunit beta [Hydrogenophaga sp.]
MSALVKVDFDTWQALQQLYSDYASAVDGGQWELWPDFFTTDGIYKLQPRENHERGFPLSTLAFDSQAMLRDRVYGIKETLFHDPYYQRHVVGAPVLREVDAQGRWHCEANYAVFRTKLDGASSVFNVGRYLDIVTQTSTGLKFAQRHCVYDSEMIPNSIIYPI